MSAARHLPAVLLALGGTTVVAALAWWGLTFWPPVSNDYLSVTEAGRCLVADSSLCRLATSLCGTRHAVLVATYPPLILWCGAAAAFCGLGSAAPRKARSDSATPRRGSREIADGEPRRPRRSRHGAAARGAARPRSRPPERRAGEAIRLGRRRRDAGARGVHRSHRGVDPDLQAFVDASERAIKRIAAARRAFAPATLPLVDRVVQMSRR